MLPGSDLIDNVRSDLQYLASAWATGTDDNTLRRGSPLLRRLLVDGELQRAWRAAGNEGQPVVKAVCLDLWLTATDRSKIFIATAGGATHMGVAVAGMLMGGFRRTPEEIKARAGLVPEREFRLTEFADSPCLLADGRTISRRTVVKFVANKLGGAHYDVKRDDDKEGQDFGLLDKTWSITLANKPAVYFDLLATGQALANSPDLRRFAGL